MLSASVKDLLSIMDIKNGVLELPGVSVEEMKELYRIMSADLMDMKIPHYRVIAAQITGTVKPVRNVVMKQAGTNRSYVELLRLARDLIFSRGGGITRALNWECPDELIDTFGFMQAERSVTSSNGALHFMGMGDATVESMVQDVDIMTMSGNGCTLRFITKLGTGVCEFEESERLLIDLSKYQSTVGEEVSQGQRVRYTQNKSGFVPFRAIYDLNNNVMLKPYQPEDGYTLKFIYKSKISEKVFTQIIQGYAKTL